MTVHATVAATFCQMIMGGKKKACYFLMTGETPFLADSFLPAFMAGRAIFSIWFMLKVANHGFSVTAMGTMAGKTSFDCLREIIMHLRYLALSMTFSA
jgi:hypothetical protein